MPQIGSSSMVHARLSCDRASRANGSIPSLRHRAKQHHKNNQYGSPCCNLTCKRKLGLAFVRVLLLLRKLALEMTFNIFTTKRVSCSGQYDRIDDLIPCKLRD